MQIRLMALLTVIITAVAFPGISSASLETFGTRGEAQLVTVQATASPIANPSPEVSVAPAPTDMPRSAPPLSLTLVLGFTCCALGLVFGLLVLAFVLSRQDYTEKK